ncbi:hypothetical protein [Vreelandella alkaliphila]|uniref:hypothetical protein n=1 Tax=Vreelandella alkaliphila TaxID=272774 RepID=UPI003F9CD1D2
MGSVVTIPEAARAYGASDSTVRRWIASGCPVERRGGRGRGHSTLLNIDAVNGWLNSCDGDSGDALAEFYGRVPELVASAVWQTFLAMEGPHKRACAGTLAFGWYQVCAALADELGTEPPTTRPATIERLVKIAAN